MRSKLFHITMKLRLVDLNYNFECDWLIKLSNNKLFGNKLASELMEKRSSSNQSIEEIVIFMIMFDTVGIRTL